MTRIHPAIFSEVKREMMQDNERAKSRLPDRAKHFCAKYANGDPKAIKSLERILASVFRLGVRTHLVEITADREVTVRRGSKTWVRVMRVGFGLFRCQNCEMTFTYFDGDEEVTEMPVWCPICKAKFVPAGSPKGSLTGDAA